MNYSRGSQDTIEQIRVGSAREGLEVAAAAVLKVGSFLLANRRTHACIPRVLLDRSHDQCAEVSDAPADVLVEVAAPPDPSLRYEGGELRALGGEEGGGARVKEMRMDGGEE